MIATIVERCSFVACNCKVDVDEKAKQILIAEIIFWCMQVRVRLVHGRLNSCCRAYTMVLEVL